MKKLFTVLALGMLLAAQAQTDTVDAKPYIEVTGTAEKEVVPDMIFITITLKDKVENKDNYTIAAQEDKLKKALQSLGIDLKNLSLSDATSGVIVYKRKEKGVEQTKEYTLKVTTAAQVSSVFEALYNSNIKEAAITKTDYSQMDALRKEVRINAIKAAKDKAAYLLQAIGEEPGKPLIVTEQEREGSYRNNLSIGANYMVENDGKETDLDFKKITVKFSYYVKFSIK